MAGRIRFAAQASTPIAHFREQAYVAHAGRHKHLFKHLAYPFANSQNVIFRLFRMIGDAHAAGQINERDIRPGFFFQFHCQREQLPGQLRIIRIGHGIGCKERMDAKMLCALLHQHFVCLHHLLPGHTVFGIAGVIHNAVGNGKMAAGIKAAADGFGYARHLFQKFHMGQVVQIDDRAHFFGQLHHWN